MSAGLSAQNAISGSADKINLAEPKYVYAEDFPGAKQNVQKAFGDTIFYEDFDSTSVANNWTIADPSGNSTPWFWTPSGTAPGGQYTGAAALASATESNGYMILPADLYNTPTPVGGFNNMNTFFQSGPIDLRDSSGNPRFSVLASFQHSLRYCCNAGTVDLLIEASPDGLTWTDYDASVGVAVNGATTNGVTVTVNLSSALGGQDTGYVRIRANGMPQYYWMVDDLLIFEGPGNNVEMSYTEVNFHPSVPLVPQYYEVPIFNVPNITSEGAVANGGGNVATGVDLNLDIVGASNGLVFSSTTPVRTGTLQPLEVDTGFITTSYSAASADIYDFNYSTTSDSVNLDPSEALESRSIALTNDSIWALETASWSGTSGPGAYQGSAGNGDAVGAIVVLEQATAVNAVRFWVENARNEEIHDLAISPRVWGFDQTQVIRADSVYQSLDNGITGVECSSPFSTTIDTCETTCPPNQTSIMDTWIDLTFLQPCTLQPGTYYYGVEQTSLVGEIWSARDGDAEDRAVLWSNIMFLPNSTTASPWGFGGFVIGLRMDGDLVGPVGIEEESAVELDFEVYPNPNEGLFTLEIANAGVTTYMMNVRNMLGQNVVSEAINVNGDVRRDIDLTSFEKGVYFVSLENGDERLVRKVVVK